ncbi:MAG: YjfB family protein [Peptococcaceae bacterium]|jgi:hypothetical protein|nr:YjfB family protein [Peptococcaceae bacterium]
MDISAIGAASIDLSMGKAQTNVEVEMLKKTMNLEKVMAASLIESMQTAAPRSFGHRLDVLA